MHTILYCITRLGDLVHFVDVDFNKSRLLFVLLPQYGHVVLTFANAVEIRSVVQAIGIDLPTKPLATLNFAEKN